MLETYFIITFSQRVKTLIPTIYEKDVNMKKTKIRAGNSGFIIGNIE